MCVAAQNRCWISISKLVYNYHVFNMWHHRTQEAINSKWSCSWSSPLSLLPPSPSPLLCLLPLPLTYISFLPLHLFPSPRLSFPFSSPFLPLSFPHSSLWYIPTHGAIQGLECQVEEHQHQQTHCCSHLFHMWKFPHITEDWGWG